MRPEEFPPKLLAVASSVCSSETVHLNSERIEQRFGDCGIEILTGAGQLRHTSLYSSAGDAKTCRTYAIVRFADEQEESADEEHAQVLAGQSIGAIFKESGWTLHKRTLYIGNLVAPQSEKQARRLMRLSGDIELAVHVYQLIMTKGQIEFEYATIMEVHHPDYLSAADLSELYACDVSTGLSADDFAQLSAMLMGAGGQTKSGLSKLDDTTRLDPH